MILTIRSRAFLAWAVFCAVLTGSIAPAFSQALGADAAGNRSVVCSALGPKTFAARTARHGEGGNPSPIHSPFEHCPLCSLHANALGMPPARLSVLPAAAFEECEPPRRDVPAARWVAWRTAQPRAPPSRV